MQIPLDFSMPHLWVAMLFGIISFSCSILIARFVYIGSIKSFKYRMWMLALATTNLIFLVFATATLIKQDDLIARNCKAFAAYLSYGVLAMISFDILDTFQILSNNPSPRRILAGKLLISISYLVGFCFQLANMALGTSTTNLWVSHG